MHDRLQLVAIRQMQLEGNGFPGELTGQMDAFTGQHSRRSGREKRLRDVAQAARHGGVAQVRVQVLQMEDAAHRERGEMLDEDLRIGCPIDRCCSFTHTLQTMRHGPREQRHMEIGCDRLQQVVDPLFLDRVDGDDGMTGLDQRLEIACGIGIRHVPVILSETACAATNEPASPGRPDRWSRS